MIFFRPVLCKALLSGASIDEVNKASEVVANGIWEYLHDSDDATLHVAQVVEIPEDDELLFRKRANYFIYHVTALDVPWQLKYPRERVLPPCPTCRGTGEVAGGDEPDNPSSQEQKSC